MPTDDRVPQALRSDHVRRLNPGRILYYEVRNSTPGFLKAIRLVLSVAGLFFLGIPAHAFAPGDRDVATRLQNKIVEAVNVQRWTRDTCGPSGELRARDHPEPVKRLATVGFATKSQPLELPLIEKVKSPIVLIGEMREIAWDYPDRATKKPEKPLNSPALMARVRVIEVLKRAGVESLSNDVFVALAAAFPLPAGSTDSWEQLSALLWDVNLCSSAMT